MRCLACNKILNDFEATRKSAITGEYIDLCNHCFQPVERDVEADTIGGSLEVDPMHSSGFDVS